MVKKKTGIKACIVVIFLFCIQIGTNTQADDGCFEGFSSIPGNLKYSLDCDPSNPSEINPGESKEINVIGKAAPYSWEVIGNGFSLEHEQTIEEPNILHADNSACGTAEVIITDALGKSRTCNVRSINGRWDWLCSGTNTAGTCAGRVWYEEITGDTKLRLGVGCHYHPYECIYYSCGGYTSYVPPGNWCYEVCPGERDFICEDQGPAGCCYANVCLEVYKWTCP